MKEVSPGIFVITENGFRKKFPPPVNVYVITGSNGLIFDAGYGLKGAVKKLLNEYNEIKEVCRSRNEDFNIKRILPSHSHMDHISGLKKLKESLSLSVIMTEKMSNTITSAKKYLNRFYERRSLSQQFSSRYFPGIFSTISIDLFYMLYGKFFFGMEFVKNADIIIPENSTIDINGEEWQIFPSPGHCRHHISLYNPKLGILFGGDNILRTITTWLGPPDSDLLDYKTSLEYMLSLPKLELILSAHGSPVTDPEERINKIIMWREKRTGQVFDIVSSAEKKGITVKDIIKKLYPASSGSTKTNLAKGWVQLSLMQLMDENRVMRKRVIGKSLFSPV